MVRFGVMRPICFSKQQREESYLSDLLPKDKEDTANGLKESE